METIFWILLIIFIAVIWLGFSIVRWFFRRGKSAINKSKKTIKKRKEKRNVKK